MFRYHLSITRRGVIFNEASQLRDNLNITVTECCDPRSSDHEDSVWGEI